MKRELRILFCLSLVLILSFSFISAFSFSDFWETITGQAVENTGTWTECLSNVEGANCNEVCNNKGKTFSNTCTTSRGYENWGLEAWWAGQNCQGDGAGQQRKEDFSLDSSIRWKCCCEGIFECIPNCAGKECGDDGCGGSCGACDEGYECSDGQCVEVVYDGKCVDEKGNDMTAEIYVASLNNPSLSLAFACEKALYGTWTCYNDDGCEINQKCSGGKCVKQVQSSGICSGVAMPCFKLKDITSCKNQQGCSWGSITASAIAPENPLPSSCSGIAKDCKDFSEKDFCENQQGCSWKENCVPNCVNKECGDDGCGGSCGTCGEDYGCVKGICVEGSSPEGVCSGTPTVNCANYREGIPSEISGALNFGCSSQAPNVCGDINCQEYEYDDYTETECDCALIKDCEDLTQTQCGIVPGCSWEFPAKVKNKKDISKYFNDQVFLISDKNWKDVLPLVPLTTWTQQQGDDSECQRGYGTPDGVCVYPTLIWHEEEKRNKLILRSDMDSFDYILDGEPDNKRLYDDQGNFVEVLLVMWSYSSAFIPNEIGLGEETTLTFTVKNIASSGLPQHLGQLIINAWLPSGSLTSLTENTRIESGNIVIDVNEDIVDEKQFNLKFRLDGVVPLFFDADSIIYFMQQYNAGKVTIIGETPQELDNLLIAEPELGAGINQNQVQRIKPEDYLNYWVSYEDVVYVEDNYELGLMASIYASLINAPLIIQGISLDIDKNFEDKNIICVGNVNKNCDESYSLDELQKKYVDMTNTDKIVLVNPNDLNIKVEELFQPEKSANPIYEIYSKTSLASPILASAKHEVIFSIKLDSLNDDSKEVDVTNRVYVIDDYLKQKVNSLNIGQGYLTILSSPDGIESRYYYEIDHSGNYLLSNADTAKYSSSDDDFLIEFATGRIFGISISDVSSYISRSIFNDQIYTGEKVLLLAGDFVPEIAETLAYKEKVYPFYNYPSEDFIEYDSCCPDPNPSMYRNKMLIQYKDHGNNVWLGINSWDIPYLDNTFFITSACSTCIYYNHKHANLFCSQAIRKGASGYIGMHVGGGPALNYQYIVSALTNNVPLGDIWNGAMMSHGLFDQYGADIAQNANGFIGDPTLILRFPHQLPKSELIRINDEKYKINLKVTKVPLNFNYKQHELNLDTYISSLYSDGNEMYIYSSKEIWLDDFYNPVLSQVRLKGLIKVGPIEEGYSNVRFSEPSIEAEIIEREKIDMFGKEILWIRIRDPTYPFNYQIDVTDGRFEDYELHFSLEK